MPFMVGPAPITRTLKYLEAGRIFLKDRVKIFSVNYNKNEAHHKGASDFVFWHLCQLQYKNPQVQVLTFIGMTPTPFITCYFDNKEKMLIDIDSKEKDEILEHVIKVVGKSRAVLKAEQQAKVKRDNPANFGYMCEKHCMCEIPGQITCPGVIPLPYHMRGKYHYQPKPEPE